MSRSIFNLRLINQLLSGGYLGILVLIGLEVWRYHGFLANRFAFDPGIWVGSYLSLLLVYRLLWDKPAQLLPLVKKINKVLIPATLIIGTWLFALENYTHTNFVFAHLSINHLALTPLLILALFVHILTDSAGSLRKHWPFYFFVSFLLTGLYLQDYHHSLMYTLSMNRGGEYDDNFVEWLQVLILLVGVGIGARLSFGYRHSKPKLVLLILVTLVFIFLAGEEVSWFDKFISYDLPKSEVNIQGEFNLHNLEGVNEIFTLLYIAAFIYAFSSFLAKRLALRRGTISDKNRFWFNVFCFKGDEVWYFLPTFIFNPYADRTIFEGHPPILNLYEGWGLLPDFFDSLYFLSLWRESFEVLFYMGLVIHFYRLYQEMPRSR